MTDENEIDPLEIGNEIVSSLKLKYYLWLSSSHSVVIAMSCSK